jgi:hypothetical protein
MSNEQSGPIDPLELILHRPGTAQVRKAQTCKQPFAYFNVCVTREQRWKGEGAISESGSWTNGKAEVNNIPQ